MLVEQVVREKAARRTWVVATAYICGTGAWFLYIIGMGCFRAPLTALASSWFGDTARDLTDVALIFASIAVFLIPFGLGLKYADRFKTVCPCCDKDISAGTDQVLSTRSCSACGERIVDGGRAHSGAVYKRRQRIRSRVFLKHWLWAWPALGGTAIAWHSFNRSVFAQCPQLLWISPLIGTAAAGWAWLRTSDRRYIPQALTCIVLLFVGSALFWQAW